MSESSELDGAIRQFLNAERKTPEEIREKEKQELYKGTATKVIIALGCDPAIRKITDSLKGESRKIEELVKEVRPNADDALHSAISEAAKDITCIPNPDDAEALLMTSIYGRPLGRNPEGEVVAHFSLVAKSEVDVTKDLNYYGQSQSTAKPNPQETNRLLGAILKTTGFFPEVSTDGPDYAFGRLKLQLKRTAKADLSHPADNKLHMHIKKTQDPTKGIYDIQITYSNP